MNIRMKKKHQKNHMYQDTWSLDYYIAKFVLPRLKLFKKVERGYPCDLKSIDEWHDILECDYLKGLLNGFTIYMDTNKLNKNEEFMLFMGNPCIDTTAKSIEELYTNFRIFVEGYCKVYEGK